MSQAYTFNALQKPAPGELIASAKAGNAEGVKELLARRADINEKDADGYTALIWAVCNNYEEVAKLLINRDAGIDDRNKLGNTALILAARAGFTDIVRLLIDNSADIALKNNLGNSAVMAALRANHMEIVRLLKAEAAMRATIAQRQKSLKANTPKFKLKGAPAP